MAPSDTSVSRVLDPVADGRSLLLLSALPAPRLKKAAGGWAWRRRRGAVAGARRGACRGARGGEGGSGSRASPVAGRWRGWRALRQPPGVQGRPTRASPASAAQSGPAPAAWACPPPSRASARAASAGSERGGGERGGGVLRPSPAPNCADRCARMRWRALQAPTELPAGQVSVQLGSARRREPLPALASLPKREASCIDTGEAPPAP